MMQGLNVYYITKRPGYVTQMFKEENLIKYDADYIAQYDNYDPWVNHFLNADRLRLLDQFYPSHYGYKPKLLDIGYGRGEFLRICSHSNSMDLYGYDIADLPVPEFVKRVDNIDGEYDIVTFFDSLEHIPVNDIVPYLKQFNTKCFMISVPWFHSTASQEWFMNWRHRRENEHLHFFDSFGLVNIMNEIGFRVVHLSNNEDCHRKSADDKPNILTIIAIKND